MHPDTDHNRDKHKTLTFDDASNGTGIRNDELRFRQLLSAVAYWKEFQLRPQRELQSEHIGCGWVSA